MKSPDSNPNYTPRKYSHKVLEWYELPRVYGEHPFYAYITLVKVTNKKYVILGSRFRILPTAQIEHLVNSAIYTNKNLNKAKVMIIKLLLRYGD